MQLDQILVLFHVPKGFLQAVAVDFLPHKNEEVRNGVSSECRGTDCESNVFRETTIRDKSS